MHSKMNIFTTQYKNGEIKMEHVNDKIGSLYEERLPLSVLKRTHLLLPFKLYSKSQDTTKFKQRLGVGISNKYKTISNDLKQRIRVDEPIDDVITIIDIDKDYFRHIDGRQVNQYTPAYKSYKTLVNDLLRARHSIGITTDCISNIQVNYKNELNIYDLSVQRLTEQTTYFDDFIKEDYQKSMELLGQWEKLRCDVDLKAKQIQHLANEKFTIMSRLVNLDYIYSVQQKYGRFLYYLSPPSWRMANRKFARSIEIQHKGFDLGKTNDNDTFDVIFDKLSEICFGTTVKTALYFNEPSEIITIFAAMEQQQLYYFTHVNHLAPFIKILKDKIRLLKRTIIQDTSSIIQLINYFKGLLKLSEENCSHLEMMFLKILNGMFYDSTAATDVLKLNFHLQFCYENVFGEKASITDIVDVSKTLEKFYMDYSKSLDTIQSVTARRRLSKYEERQQRTVRNAKKAATELRLFYRLEQKLLRTYNMSNTTNNAKIIQIPKENRQSSIVT